MKKIMKQFGYLLGAVVVTYIAWGIIALIWHPSDAVSLVISFILGIVCGYAAITAWDTRFFHRCWECNRCVCHKGWWRFVCWADCRLGHGAKIPFLSNLICEYHDKHIWKVAGHLEEVIESIKDVRQAAVRDYTQDSGTVDPNERGQMGL